MTVTGYNEERHYADPDANFVDHGESESRLGRYHLVWNNNPSCDDHKDIRTHPIVHEVVEELGLKEASGPCCLLKFVEIPYDNLAGWHIEEYDGAEWIAEDHETWS